MKVFLCHSSEDKAAVRELYRRLKDENIDPWLDEENLVPGQSWDMEIQKAVRNCDVVLICLSSGFVIKEGYGQKEIKLALDAALEKPDGIIYLIPLKLEECKVPERLRHLHWVNYFEESGFNKLIRALKIRAESLNDVLPVGSLYNPVAFTFPQIKSIANNELREKVERAFTLLNEETVDAGLFLLSREFEATIHTFLIEASLKNKIQTVPTGEPVRWTLVSMIDCVAKNGVITDRTVLHYLRLERNDRAHGSTPTLAERKLLMNNVKFLAGLYIDYIKFFDDLTSQLRLAN